MTGTIRLVRGGASPEEIAAVVTVLAAAAGEDGDDPTGRTASQWGTHRRVFHPTYPHGPGSWRASALPR